MDTWFKKEEIMPQEIFNIQLKRTLWRPLFEMKAKTGRNIKEFVEKAVEASLLEENGK